MVTLDSVVSQLRSLGVKPNFISSGEIRELPNILVPGEEIFHAVMGWHEGGLGLLCATNHRVLLIDKKVFFLTVEDLRYDMIVEVKYQYRMLDASVDLTYARRSLEFKSWNQPGLRQLVAFVQETTMEIRRRREEQGQEIVASVPELVHKQMVAPLIAKSPVAFQDMPHPAEYEQPGQQATWKNPYRTGQQILRRTKASRFITQTQLSD